MKARGASAATDAAIPPSDVREITALLYVLQVHNQIGAVIFLLFEVVQNAENNSDDELKNRNN